MDMYGIELKNYDLDVYKGIWYKQHTQTIMYTHCIDLGLPEDASQKLVRLLDGSTIQSWMLRKLNAEKVECWGSGCNKWARTRKTSPFTGISCYNLPKGNRERSDDLQFIRTLFEWLSTIDTQLHTISHSALSTLSMDISSNLWHILPILTQKMKTIWFFFNFILSHQPISRTFQ